MADPSSSTPFLADNDHSHDHDDDYDGSETHIIKRLPANAHFKHPIRVLATLSSILSILNFGLLIASYVLIRIGPFQYTYGSGDAVRDLAICLAVNALLTIPSLFIVFPILINMIVNLSLSIVILIFSSEIFGGGWPDSNFCRRWGNIPGRPYEPLPETEECIHDRDIIRICMGVSAGVGILIGLLVLTKLLLRIVALARTRFWQGKSMPAFGWNPTGFTVQFTLSVLPHDAKTKKCSPTAEASADTEEGRLIET